MLYNPNWTETKPDVFSLDSLIAWLEKQPADQKYCYCDGGACLLQQYYTASGFENVEVYGWGRWSHSGSPRIDSPHKFWPISVGRSRVGDWTFGAALTRARAAQSQSLS